MVPGAKPLSINEVKLTKDDDEDRKQRNKRHPSSEDDDEENRSNDDSTRNGAIKKGNLLFNLTLMQTIFYNVFNLNSYKKENINSEGSFNQIPESPGIETKQYIIN